MYSSHYAYDEGEKLVAVCQASLIARHLTFEQGLSTIAFIQCTIGTAVAGVLDELFTQYGPLFHGLIELLLDGFVLVREIGHFGAISSSN